MRSREERGARSTHSCYERTTAAIRQPAISTCFARGRALSNFSSYTSIQEEELYPLLNQLRAPTLLLWGGADRPVPTAPQAL